MFSGVICDNEKQCKCFIKEAECESTSCKVNGQEGMCIGKFNLQSWSISFSIKVFLELFNRSLYIAEVKRAIPF